MLVLTSLEFDSVITFATDHNNQPHQYCLAVYYLPSGFHPQALPHGNSKSSKSFYPTLPSTMLKMKEGCEKGYGPKKVVSEVSAQVGGLIAATDSCEIPCNEQQVTKLKVRMKSSSTGSDLCPRSDELGVIMQQAFMEDASNRFIREIKCVHEPAVVVATERQLNDLVRFCTPSSNFSIMTIDPTFSLGDFDVTVITYRHKLLISRQSNCHPAIMGPLLIHYKKSFATYNFFASSLISLRRELSSIKSFGTDGEKALIDAFKHACPSSLHLICSIHVRRNTKAKLQEMGIPERSRNVILDDIFGKRLGSHYSEGLVDAPTCEMFDTVFQALTNKWQALDLSGEALNNFVQWFQRYKSDIIKDSMLRPVREKAGLGAPPIAFTTNASESINAMLKRKVDYKRNELPVFLEKVKELIHEQDEEIEKAVVSRGKYVVNPEFKKFVKSESEWFTKMKEGERVRHLQRFATFKLPETLPIEKSVAFNILGHSDGSTSHGVSAMPSSSISISLDMDGVDSDSYSEFGYPSAMHSVYPQSESNPPTHSSSQHADDLPSFAGANSSSEEDEVPPPKRVGVRRQLFPHRELSVDYMEFSEQVFIPEMVLESIWRKASELLTSPNAIASAPGLDSKAHTVMSYSGKRPHLVSAKKTGQYVCDKACGNWNSLNLCSHTVAVAETNGELRNFVSWLTKAKKKPSVTKLVVTGMPSGRGRKGGKTTQHKKKVLPITSRTPIVSLASGTTPGVSTSSQSSSSSMPVHPPPLIHLTPQSPSPGSETSEPFVLCFISGNISVCYGCRQKYPKPCVPPNDLCVRHKEWREFFPPGSATAQARFGNVYYHCNVPCIQARCPFFSSNLLQIPALMAVQLLPVHTEYLAAYMGRTTSVRDE